MVLFILGATGEGSGSDSGIFRTEISRGRGHTGSLMAEPINRQNAAPLDIGCAIG